MWDICEGRKNEAVNERMSLLKEGWLEDHMSTYLNLFIGLIQAEIDRFAATQAIVEDYYSAYSSSIPPERPRERFILPGKQTAPNQARTLTDSLLTLNYLKI